MSSVTEGKMCPWMGLVCPGEDQCAPAAIAADGQKDESGDPAQPICPIVIGVDALATMSAEAAIALATRAMDQKPPDEKGKLSDAEARAKVIGALNIDQRSE